MLQEREKKKKELEEKKAQKKVDKQQVKPGQPGKNNMTGAQAMSGMPLAYHPGLMQGMMQYPPGMMGKSCDRVILRTRYALSPTVEVAHLCMILSAKTVNMRA